MKQKKFGKYIRNTYICQHQTNQMTTYGKKEKHPLRTDADVCSIRIVYLCQCAIKNKNTSK